MPFRLGPWRILGLSVAAAAIAASGIYFFWTRATFNSSKIISFVPVDNAAVVYIDVAALQHAGILNMIAGSKAAEEYDYRQFVEQSGFDYRQDLDAVAAAFRDHQVFLALRGRFQWKKLRLYALGQGGSCHDDYCVLAGSQPGRRISFYPVRRDLLGMAVSSDDFAAYRVALQRGKPSLTPPDQPVWALVPAGVWKDPGALPAGAKAYVSALQNAEQALFTIGPSSDHLQLGVRVTCSDAAAASALLMNLESITNTLRAMIAREHQHPNPADLSALLVGGTFRREDRSVEGHWPIPQAFLQAITSGSF